MAKQKEHSPQAEVEVTPDNHGLLKEFSNKEPATFATDTRLSQEHPLAEGMETGLFKDLKASIREAGAIVRGELKATRRTHVGDAG